MTVATWLQTANQNQLWGNYAASLDGNFAVHQQLAGAFAPHEARTLITGYYGGSGGVGSYYVNIAQTVGSGSSPVTFTLGNTGAAVVTGYILPLGVLVVLSVVSGTVLVGQYVTGSTTIAPNMTVVVDAGAFMNNGALVAPPQQTTAAFTAPAAGYQRIDRIVIDQQTGVQSVITGTPTTGTPAAPAIPAGKNACAQVLLSGSTTAITNSLITDERVASSISKAYADAAYANLSASNIFTADQSINGITVGRGGGGNSANTILGNGAMPNSTPGSSNTAVGALALHAANSSSGTNNNTAVGYSAGAALNGSAASGNTMIGMQAGYQASASLANTLVGALACDALTTGGTMVAVGYCAGLVAATGSSGTYVGANTSASSASVSNEIVLGYNLTGKGANTAYVGGASGAYNGANTTSWATTSDRRIKQNITPLASGLAVIAALNPVEFDYIEDGKHETGFIAQEYQAVLPAQIITHAASAAQQALVGGGEVLAIQQNLIPYLVKAMQELKAEFDAYRAAHP